MPIAPTPYADMNPLLSQLLSSIQNILGEKLIGLYLYGSLVTGDFDYGSDEHVDHAATYPETLRFAHFVINLYEHTSGVPQPDPLK